MLRLDNDATPKELKILTGNGGYTAQSSDPESVEAQIVTDDAVPGGFKLVMKGLKSAADVTVALTDAKRKSAQVKVRVTDPIIPVSFDVEGPLSGEYRYNDTPAQITFHIASGNGGYAVSSSNEQVARVEVNAATVTVTVVGDGGTTIRVDDQEQESCSIDLWVPMNPDDPTPRIAWDGYRADHSTEGVSFRETFATGKSMYWDQQVDSGETNTCHVFFNGGFSPGLQCVKASNRNPKIEITIDGVKTTYDDKTSAVPLSSFILVNQINPNPTPELNPRTYWISFEADGKQGFIVFAWNYK